MGYLEDLTIRLARGAAELPADFRQQQAEWILEAQQPEGGWCGREGDADLYYTGFAARTLMILGLLDGPVAERTANFLRSKLTASVGVVDLISLLMAGKVLELSCGIDVLKDADKHWRIAMSQLLERLRRKDGGYAKSDEGQAGSTYQTFLSLIAYEIIELSPPDPESIRQFIERHEHPEGGFLEIRVGKRAGVNPTAAAVGAMRMLNAIEERILNGVPEFLLSLQTDDGGWAANTRIPLADVLSTFTALVTLIDLGAAKQANLANAANYIHSMARPGGGFAGFELDPAKDVEYTFYGLGGLALLANEAASQAN
jgi:geranylgeranyl transferase type-2 subunit beta